MEGRFDNKMRRDEEEGDYDRRDTNRSLSQKNKIEDKYVRDLTDQMGLTALKKGLLEHKANIKPEVYFVGQIVGGFNFEASE